MKTALAATLAIALLAALAPIATAQSPEGVSITIDASASVPYAGSGEFPFTVKVGCLSALPGGLTGTGNAPVTVTILDAPAWLTFEPVTASAPLADCDQNGQTTATGTLPFTVSDAAPAVVQSTVTLEARVGETADQQTGVYTVAYNSDYSLVPSVEFPLTVTNKTTTFTVAGTQASNAPSMIMVDDFSCDSGALIAGIGALQYANKAGTPETKTYTVTFTAPKTEWTKATCSLEVYGHYNFDGMAGDPEDRATITWEFANGGVPADKSSSGGGSEKSPAPVFAFVALGLLALAALRRKA